MCSVPRAAASPVPSAVRAPFHRWMEANIRPEQVVFRASDDAALEVAIRSGAGIGFLGTRVGDRATWLPLGGDALTFIASSDDIDVAEVSVSGAELIITEVGAGSSIITVTADDGNGGSTSTSFELTVQ